MKFLLALSIGLLFTACGKTEPENKRQAITPEESEQSIEEISDEELAAIIEGEGFNLNGGLPIPAADLENILGTLSFVREIPVPNRDYNYVVTGVQTPTFSINQAAVRANPFTLNNFALGAYCVGAGCQFNTNLPQWVYGNYQQYINQRVVVRGLPSLHPLRTSIGTLPFMIGGVSMGLYQSLPMGGLQASIYRIPRVGAMPNVALMAPAAVYTAPNVNVPTRDYRQGWPGHPGFREHFAVAFRGTLYVPTPWTGTLRSHSDDGMNVYINGVRVINNDGLHAPRVRDGVVTLAAGYHSIAVDYFQGPRRLMTAQLKWNYGGVMRPIEPQFLSPNLAPIFP